MYSGGGGGSGRVGQGLGLQTRPSWFQLSLDTSVRGQGFPSPCETGLTPSLPHSPGPPTFARVFLCDFWDPVHLGSHPWVQQVGPLISPEQYSVSQEDEVHQFKC